MPTYEYVCTACGHSVEVVQSMTDERLKTCGVCGGELRKVFHAAGIVFKGEGFYATDSRAKQKPTGADSKKEGAGSKESAKEKGAGKSDESGGKKKDSSSSSGGGGKPSDSGASGSSSGSKKKEEESTS